MGTTDADSDLDREIARLKLRDIVIGSAVAAVLLAMMPGHAQRGTASTTSGRARVSTPLLPKPKTSCMKSAAPHCQEYINSRHHSAADYVQPGTAHHSVDIRV